MGVDSHYIHQQFEIASLRPAKPPDGFLIRKLIEGILIGQIFVDSIGYENVFSPSLSMSNSKAPQLQSVACTLASIPTSLKVPFPSARRRC